MPETLLSAEDVAGLVERLLAPDWHDPACPFSTRCHCGQDGEPAPHDRVRDDDKIAAATTISTLAARVEEAERERVTTTEKRAPVQGFAAGIPWSMHLRAYDVYAKKYGAQKALIDLEGRNCRGGFGTEELDMFIPGWRDELSETAALKASLEKVTAERDEATKLMLQYAREAGEAKGRLEMSEAAGIVDGWRERTEAAEAETARMRKALERVSSWSNQLAALPPELAAAIREALSPASEGGE